MQHLLPVTVRRLRIAAARLRDVRRRNASELAIWIAARNYRRTAAAAPEDAAELLNLPYQLVEAIEALTPDHDAATKETAPDDPTPNARL